ncbi:unnamed protein product, partial [Laminaria digitata]
QCGEVGFQWEKAFPPPPDVQMGRQKRAASLFAWAIVVPAAVTAFGIIPSSPFASPSRAATAAPRDTGTYRHRCCQGGRSNRGISGSISMGSSTTTTTTTTTNGASRSALVRQLQAGTMAGAGAERRRPRRRRRRLLLSPLSASSAADEEAPLPSPPPSSASLSEAERTAEQPTAEETAEAALRKLSPSELEGMKPRLGLDRQLEGEAIIAGAIPILAAKIQARALAQEVGRSAAAAAAAAASTMTTEDRVGSVDDAAAAPPSASPASPSANLTSSSAIPASLSANPASPEARLSPAERSAARSQGGGR